MKFSLVLKMFCDWLLCINVLVMSRKWLWKEVGLHWEISVTGFRFRLSQTTTWSVIHTDTTSVILSIHLDMVFLTPRSLTQHLRYHQQQLKLDNRLLQLSGWQTRANMTQMRLWIIYTCTCERFAFVCVCTVCIINYCLNFNLYTKIRFYLGPCLFDLKKTLLNSKYCIFARVWYCMKKSIAKHCHAFR